MEVGTLIKGFQQLQLTDMQTKLLHVTPDQFATLREGYQKRTESQRNPAHTLEQMLVGIPLWVLTQPKPANQDEMAYIKLALGVQEAVEQLHFQLEEFFFKTGKEQEAA